MNACSENHVPITFEALNECPVCTRIETDEAIRATLVAELKAAGESYGALRKDYDTLEDRRDRQMADFYAFSAQTQQMKAALETEIAQLKQNGSDVAADAADLRAEMAKATAKAQEIAAALAAKL